LGTLAAAVDDPSPTPALVTEAVRLAYELKVMEALRASVVIALPASLAS